MLVHVSAESKMLIIPTLISETISK